MEKLLYVEIGRILILEVIQESQSVRVSPVILVIKPDKVREYTQRLLIPYLLYWGNFQPKDTKDTAENVKKVEDAVWAELRVKITNIADITGT